MFLGYTFVDLKKKALFSSYAYIVSLALSAVSATPDSLVTQTSHKRLLFHSIPSYKVER